jgi:hypothetical protein
MYLLAMYIKSAILAKRTQYQVNRREHYQILLISLLSAESPRPIDTACDSSDARGECV